MNTRFFRALGAIPALLVASVQAGEIERMSVGASPPSAAQIGEFLFPEQSDSCKDESRKYQCLSIRPAVPRAIGMNVKFPTDSAELTPEAKEQLAPFGKALAGRSMDPGEILIEGHTDSRGTAEHNKRLSERRAQSVVRYLVQGHGVNAKALRPVGRGMEEPIENRADSQANRRVEVVRQPVVKQK